VKGKPMNKKLSPLVSLFALVSMTQSALTETITSRFGFSITIPNGFQPKPFQLPSDAPDGILDVKLLSNPNTYEEVYISTQRFEAGLISELQNNWPSSGEAAAVSMSVALRKSIKATNDLDCVYKAAPLYRQGKYGFVVQSNFSCSKANQNLTAVYFAASFMTKEGTHSFRMQCAVNTNESCKDSFLRSVDSIKTLPSSSLP